MDLSLAVMTSEDDCIACSNGTFCPVGSTNATLCAAGTYNAFERRIKCDKCAAGTYQDAEGATVCKECDAGAYCKEGASAPLPCPAGTHQNQSLTTPMTSETQCVECGEGTFCPVGSANATKCSPGFFNPLPRQAACARCEAGRYQNASGALDCWVCEPGHYCLEGASAPLPCPSGTHQDLTLTTPMTSDAQCVACGAGTFCPTGAEAPTNCSAGTFGEGARQSECTKCEAGRFQVCLCSLLVPFFAPVNISIAPSPAALPQAQQLLATGSTDSPLLTACAGWRGGDGVR